MCPGFTMNYELNIGSRYRVFSGHNTSRHTRFTVFSYFKNILIGELGSRVFFSRKSPFKPSFFHGIMNVIFVCAKKKMVWVYTSPIIAGMTNKNTFWYWSSIKYIGNSVCELCSTIKSKLTVTLAVFKSVPVPTPVDLVFYNLTHKPFHSGYVLQGVTYF